MTKALLTPKLSREYEDLFRSCRIKTSKLTIIEKIIEKILDNKKIYEQIESAVRVPWFFAAAIHNLEASLSFKAHLHNGDSLKERTTQIPRGRPINGNPPFSWTESAIDALALDGLAKISKWNLVEILFRMEKYNGWGYRSRHPEVLSPYLWSYSTHYTSGKYIADGTWSSTAVSNQIGGAVLLRRMVELDIINLPGQTSPREHKTTIPRYSINKNREPNEALAATHLQEWLNTFPDIFLRVDGIPGTKTSNAYKKVTGKYLPGDPRN